MDYSYIIGLINGVKKKCCCNKTLVTQEGLNLLVEKSGLVSGRQYTIKGTNGESITLTADSKSTLTPAGSRVMLVPTTYKVETLNANIWKGVWHITKTADAGDLMIWGGLVWRNLTGAIGTATNDILLDGTNWEVVPKASFLNAEYTPMSFYIIYDYTNSWIVKQWDTHGNEFGMSYEFYQESGLPANPVEMSSWNYTQDDTTDNLISDNRVIGIWNNGEGVRIIGNVFNGIISNNKLTSGAIINNNFLTTFVGTLYAKISDNTCGSITGNVCGGIYNNSIIGYITQNNIVGPIYDNESPVTNINQNSGADQIRQNSNSGRIAWNSLAGGSIYDNSNAGQIATNQCSNIMSNSNGGQIAWNVGSGDINSNSNVGSIYSNTGMRNPVGGAFVSGNTNTGSIYENHIAGWISGNSGIGNVYHNDNNGNITNNDLAGFNIFHNENNGNIDSATLVADVTDAAVNK